MHDCILDTVPIFCFSYHGPHGHSELHNSTLADSRCSDTAASRGIQFVLGVMLVAVNRGSPPVHLDSRCVGRSVQACCAQLWAVFAWLAVPRVRALLCLVNLNQAMECTCSTTACYSGMCGGNWV